MAVDVRFFKLGKGTSLPLGSVSGLVAWGEFLFLNNLCSGTWFENFRIWDFAINFLELGLLIFWN